MRATAIFITALLLLAGCATSPDPAQGGFISGVNGILSGNYDRRVRVQSDELTRLRMEQAAAEDQARRASSAVADRERQLDDLHGKVARLDRSLKAAQASISRQRAQNVSLSDADRQFAVELANDKARLAALQAKLQSGSAGADYDAEKQQYLSLQAAIEALAEQLKETQSQ